jgi:hypothetical protein
MSAKHGIISNQWLNSVSINISSSIGGGGIE